MENFLQTKYDVAYFTEKAGIQILNGFDVSRKDDVCGLVIHAKPLPIIWSVVAENCMRSDVVALMQKYLQKGVQVSLPSCAESSTLCSVVHAPYFNRTLELLAQHGVDVCMVVPNMVDKWFCRDCERPFGQGICRFIIRG